MSALLIAEQFAPLHDSHIEKVTVNGDPETRDCICESIVPSAVISQIPRKVHAKKHHAAQSVSSGHAGFVLLSLGRTLKSFSGALAHPAMVRGLNVLAEGALWSAVS
jgi:hypothetical protein